MKKLLSILGSISLIASSASTVLACSDNSSKKVDSESQQTKDIRQQSVDELKGYVLADQYGLDVNKTNEKIIVQPDYVRTDTFSAPDNSVIKGLNLNGRIGKDNLPLYGLQDTLNNLLSKIKVGPVDISKYIDDFGGIIKQLPALLNENNISGLLSLVPTILNNITQFIPSLNVDPSTITWIANWIKMNIKYVLSVFNFNDKIAEIVDKVGASCTLADIYKTGIDSLVDLGNNIFFSGYESVQGFDTKNGDQATSAFIGTEIFTPLFNGKSIDTDKIKKIFSPAMLIANMKPILDDAATFLSVLLFRLSIYLPMMAETPTDRDNLFDAKKTNGKTGNDDVFGAYDKTVITHDKDNNLFMGDSKTPENVSLNASIFGTISLLADDDPSHLAIIKLTNALFNKGSEDINPLIDKVCYLLIDALKFTDYHVKISTSKSVPVIGDININLDFDLKDLFGAKKQIDIISGFSDTAAKLIIGGLTVRNLKVVLNFSGRGILDAYPKAIAPLLSTLLLGKKVDSNSLWTLVANLLGDSGDPFFVSLSYQYYKVTVFPPSAKWIDEDDPASKNGWISGTAWGLLGSELATVVDQLLETMYYTDGTKFYDALKGLSVAGNQLISDDQIASIKKSLSPLLPLSKEVTNALKNTPIGDLGELSNVLNLDSIVNILDIMFLRNTIQGNPTSTNKNKFDASDDSSDKSLFEQILLTLNDPADKKAKEWNYYLGYTNDVSQGEIASTYALRKGLIGNIIDALYPKLDNYKDDIKGLEAQDSNKDTAIGIAYLPLVPSDVMKKLGEYMAKFSKELNGKDLNYIVKPLWDDDKVWSTSNVTNKYFNGTNDVQFESYDLSFDSSSVTIYDTDENGNAIKLPVRKGTYRIWFSRTDSKSKFQFKKVEKIG